MYSMPFKHKRKTNRYFRSLLDVLKRVAKCMTEEGSSYQKAAANFNVDKMTLIRYIKKRSRPTFCSWISNNSFKKSNFYSGNGATVIVSHSAFG